ncbi:MAG: adenylate kinase [Gammaproteobacteria bacterium TMED134]|nr:MAG: adenylate kinase [Gammaproteobacteria bacterium TMED134]
MRINVVGTSGSGKSAFARSIAQKYRVPYVQLDELHWKPNWEESSDEEFFPKVEKALLSDRWILDGNYKRTIPIKWKRVQMVVYLDLPFHIVLYRVVKRSFLRGITKEELWHGNRETVWKHFFTSDSMILWTLRTFHKNRKKYTELFAREEYAHIKFVRLRNKREVESFITTELRSML